MATHTIYSTFGTYKKTKSGTEYSGANKFLAGKDDSSGSAQCSAIGFKVGNTDYYKEIYQKDIIISKIELQLTQMTSSTNTNIEVYLISSSDPTYKLGNAANETDKIYFGKLKINNGVHSCTCTKSTILKKITSYIKVGNKNFYIQLQGAGDSVNNYCGYNNSSNSKRPQLIVTYNYPTPKIEILNKSQTLNNSFKPIRFTGLISSYKYNISLGTEDKKSSLDPITGVTSYTPVFENLWDTFCNSFENTSSTLEVTVSISWTPPNSSEQTLTTEGFKLIFPSGSSNPTLSSKNFVESLTSNIELKDENKVTLEKTFIDSLFSLSLSFEAVGYRNAYVKKIIFSFYTLKDGSMVDLFDKTFSYYKSSSTGPSGDKQTFTLKKEDVDIIKNQNLEGYIDKYGTDEKLTLKYKMTIIDSRDHSTIIDENNNNNLSSIDVYKRSKRIPTINFYRTSLKDEKYIYDPLDGEYVTGSIIFPNDESKISKISSSNKNSIESVAVKIMKEGDTGWTVFNGTIDGNKYNYQTQATWGLKKITLQITYKLRFNSEVSQTIIIIDPASCIMYFPIGGRALGIGGIIDEGYVNNSGELKNHVKIHWPLRLENPLSIEYGGTGSRSPEGARTNLGIDLDFIQGLLSNGFQMKRYINFNYDSNDSDTTYRGVAWHTKENADGKVTIFTIRPTNEEALSVNCRVGSNDTIRIVKMANDGSVNFPNSVTFDGVTTFNKMINLSTANIQTGVVTIKDVSAGGFKDATVTFKTKFQSEPFVILCGQASSGGEGDSSTTGGAVGGLLPVIYTDSIGQESFKIRLYNNSNSVRSLGVRWMAFLL